MLSEQALRALDILLVHEAEGVWLGTALGGADGDALSLHEMLGIIVIRTLGGEGVEWADGGQRYHRPAPRTQVRAPPPPVTALWACWPQRWTAALRWPRLSRARSPQPRLLLTRAGSQDPAIGAAYAEGFRQLTDMVQQALPAGVAPRRSPAPGDRLPVSGMVGGIVIARALEKADPDLSKDVLAAARDELERLAFATRSVTKSG